jgi:ribosomal protein S18 acetylase RimI-like enzyme
MAKHLIREANIEDIDNGLLDVYIEGYNYHMNGRPDIFIKISYDEMKNDLLKYFAKEKIIVVLLDNKIVGYLSYVIKKHHTSKLDVDQIVIKEEYRGMGFGKELMNEVKNIAQINNCDRIELNCWMFNESALEMYEHLGFQKQRIMYEMKLK